MLQASHLHSPLPTEAAGPLVTWWKGKHGVSGRLCILQESSTWAFASFCTSVDLTSTTNDNKSRAQSSDFSSYKLLLSLKKLILQTSLSVCTSDVSTHPLWWQPSEHEAGSITWVCPLHCVQLTWESSLNVTSLYQLALSGELLQHSVRLALAYESAQGESLMSSRVSSEHASCQGMRLDF